MERIGKFDIVELLGRGAMGRVYKGTDPTLARHVVVKVMTAQADPARKRGSSPPPNTKSSFYVPHALTVRSGRQQQRRHEDQARRPEGVFQHSLLRG